MDSDMEPSLLAGFALLVAMTTLVTATSTFLPREAMGDQDVSASEDPRHEEADHGLDLDHLMDEHRHVAKSLEPCSVRHLELVENAEHMVALDERVLALR